MRLTVGATTDVGLVREHNEDSFLVFQPDESSQDDPNIFSVADGMGGHEYGREASQLCVRVLQAVFSGGFKADPPARLLLGLTEANRLIFEASASMGGTRSGTTCTAITISESETWLAHVGDSRAYRLRGSELEQMTVDHTIAQELVRGGVLTEDEAANHPTSNTLTRAVGIEHVIHPDIFPIGQTLPGDIYLISSDGMDMLADVDIKESLLMNKPQEAAGRLISLANEHGGPDNITAIVISAS